MHNCCSNKKQSQDYSWNQYWQDLCALNPYYSKDSCTCCKPIDVSSGESYAQLPQELSVDTTTSSQSTCIGGADDVNLTLEYMSAGAAASINLTVEDGGNKTVWTITPDSQDYTVESCFAEVCPGAKVTIEVVDCLARLRWCELIVC